MLLQRLFSLTGGGDLAAVAVMLLPKVGTALPGVEKWGRGASALAGHLLLTSSSRVRAQGPSLWVVFFFGLSFLSLVVIAAATTDLWVQCCTLLPWGVIITAESGGKWDKKQTSFGNAASIVLPVSPATFAAPLLVILFFFFPSNSFCNLFFMAM